MKIRTLVSLAALALLAGGGYWGWKSYGASDTPQYKQAKVERGSLTSVVSSTGTLTPVVSVQVGSQVSGQLREILVDFNSAVSAGQLIARIDPENFQHKVRQAEADLEAARAATGTQQAEILRAQVNLADAERDYERKKMLVEKNFISSSERDKAQTVRDVARAALQLAQAQSRNAAAVVRQREAQLAQAKVDLGRTSIISPVDGIVVKRSVEPGQTVAASLQAPELFVIAKSLTDMQVETAIDEADVGRIRVGQKASFTVDAFPGRNFSGEVRQVRKAATVVSNVVSYTVVITAANPDQSLLPGMTANVRIVTAQKDGVLKVHNAALRFRPAGGGDDKKPAEAAASPAPSSGHGGGGGQGSQGGPGQIREKLTKELQLDAAQQDKLAAIFDGMRDKYMAARELPEAERAKASERNRAETREKVSAILTAEQKRRYAEINAESQAARVGGGGSGRVWVLGADGKPSAVNLRLGISDGSMTEVISGELAENAMVLTGTQAASAKNPGMPGPRLF